MSPEIVTIIALVVIFAIATFLPINMGAPAFVAAFVVGTLAVGLTTDDILGGFPAELVLTLIGVTYLFAIAPEQRHGRPARPRRGAPRRRPHRGDPLGDVLRHRRRRGTAAGLAGVRRPRLAVIEWRT